MAHIHDERRRRTRAERRSALLAATSLLLKLKAIQDQRLRPGSTKLASAKTATEVMSRLVAAIDAEQNGLEDLLHELAMLLEQLERELEIEELRAAALVLADLASYAAETEGETALLSR